MSGKRVRILAVVLSLCMLVGCMTYAEEVPTTAPETMVVETEQPTEAEAPAADATVGTAEEPATEPAEEPAAEAPAEEPAVDGEEAPVEMLTLEGTTEGKAAEEACAHEHVSENDYLEGGTYTPKDSKVHTVTGHMRHLERCEDCGKTLEDTKDEEETSRAEAHYFSDGECGDCGYKSGCAHEYTRTSAHKHFSD